MPSSVIYIQSPVSSFFTAKALASDDFIRGYGYATPYSAAPEICVEIFPSSNSSQELVGKKDLYFAQRAEEVWFCDALGNIASYNGEGLGLVSQSGLAPHFPTAP
ncbi:MAG: hypothetical protein ACFCU3_09880 [Verrucomicrobiales bacterium]